MIDVIRVQREGCERAGSALYTRLLDVMAADLRRGGVCSEILAPWAENAMADAIPLRFLASIHRMVLDGRAPALAAFFPSAGGTDAGDPAEAFVAVVRTHRSEIEADMHRGVQTNEVGRAAALVGGFHWASRRFGLPVRLLEIGSSAGLLLRWDRYRYESGDAAWGPDLGVRFDDPWTGDAPRFDDDLVVADRTGCDINPIDVTTDQGVTLLRGFLWPDQVERRTRLDRAIEIARRFPARIETADAGEFLARRLAEPVPGQCTVVFHSIVLQYLPRSSFELVRSTITAAGAAATADAPICWLRMEPAGDVADVRMRCWPDGDEHLLATTGYHGPPVSWLDGAD